MDFTYTEEQEAFRAELRGWLTANLTDDLRIEDPTDGRVAPDRETFERRREWQKRMYAAGWVGISWPKAYGGRGATLMEQVIYDEECFRARAPVLPGYSGIGMAGPTIIEWGTEEQKRRFLPRILGGDDIWCQGYSEPGAGSDLAGLRTRAEDRGDHFVVNGQKVWTSGAQFADWIYLLVRSDPAAPKHRGISYLLVDMRTPGITVRPLIQMTGDPGFNEVFFEDVRVPRKNLVGELHQGWLVANATLAHERNMLGATTRTQQMFNSLLRLAQSCQRGGRPAADDPVMRQKLADLMIRVEAMKYHAFRQLTDVIKRRSPGIGASVNKLVSTELNHDIAALAMEIMGSYGTLARTSRHVVDRGSWPIEFMFTLGLIIGGGTSQIQKNIISERGLGMPREYSR